MKKEKVNKVLWKHEIIFRFLVLQMLDSKWQEKN